MLEKKHLLAPQAVAQRSGATKQNLYYTYRARLH